MTTVQSARFGVQCSTASRPQPCPLLQRATLRLCPGGHRPSRYSSSAGFLLSSFRLVDCARSSRMRVRAAEGEPSAGEPQTSADTEEEALASDPYRLMAEFLVEEHVRSGTTLGLGSGRTVTEVIAVVAMKLQDGTLSNVVGVPASDAAAAEAAFEGLPLSSWVEHEKIDVMVEEVDEVDVTTRSCPLVLGRAQDEQSQTQILKSKLVMEKSSKLLLALDSPTKCVDRLGGHLPVVIEAAEWEDTAEELDDIFLGDAEIWRRPSQGTANPRGGDNPYMSPDGHNIVDVRFYGAFKLFGDEQATYEKISTEIMAVPGVVTSGLILGHPNPVVVVQDQDGPRTVAMGAEDGERQQQPEQQ